MKGSQRAHDSLCKAIRDLLVLHGIPCWRVGQKASQRRDGSWYAGHDAGCADIHAILPGGRHWSIEAKTGKGILSEGQQGAFFAVERVGGMWTTARSVSDVDAVLKRLGGGSRKEPAR